MRRFAALTGFRVKLPSSTSVILEQHNLVKAMLN